MSQKFYCGIKADIFSTATTLFVLVMKSPPFKSSHVKDKHFARLCKKDTTLYWKTFAHIKTTPEFKGKT